jgi:phage internal scaffolding protein
MIPGKLKQRLRSQVSFLKDPSKARQSAYQGTEIDAILKKYATAGPEAFGVYLSQLPARPYGVQPSTDYQNMLNEVIKVENYFMALPSRLRERFGHNAQNMIDFIADPRNLEECRKLGLVAKPDPIAASGAAASAPPATPAATPIAPAPEKKPNAS